MAYEIRMRRMIESIYQSLDRSIKNQSFEGGGRECKIKCVS